MTDKASCNPDGWVEEYGDFLYRFALTRLRDPATAEELVQEAFLGALKSLDTYRGDSPERAWLVGILKNKIMDHFRRSSRERPLTETEGDLDELFNAKGHWKRLPEAWAADPVKVHEDKEFWKILYDCIAGLPERLARVFHLREMDDVSTDEVCKVLDLTPTNLWVMMHRARLRLRTCMEENWFSVKGKA